MPYTIETDHLKEAKKLKESIQNQLSMFHGDDGSIDKLWKELELHYDKMSTYQHPSPDENWKVIGTDTNEKGFTASDPDYQIVGGLPTGNPKP